MRRRVRVAVLLVLIACFALGTIAGGIHSPLMRGVAGRILPPALAHSPVAMLARTCARTPVVSHVGWCGNVPVRFVLGGPQPWCQYTIPLWRAEIERQRLNRLGVPASPAGAGSACPP